MRPESAYSILQRAKRASARAQKEQTPQFIAKKEVIAKQLSSTALIGTVISPAQNQQRLMQLRAERHTWYDDRNCNNYEPIQEDLAFVTVALARCRACPVINQCFNEDRASGAPKPGIVAGLTQDQRYAMYRRFDNLSISISYDFQVRTPDELLINLAQSLNSLETLAIPQVV